MGRHGYEVTGGSVTLDGVDLLSLPTWERARAGLFLALQHPTEVPGVSPGVSGRRGGPELAERLEAEGYTGVLAEAGVSVGLPTGVTHPGGHEAGFGEDPFADPLDR